MEFLTFLRAQWDRAIAVAAVVVGLVVLLIGWIGVSGSEAVVKQLPYIMSGGIAGVLFVAIGAVLWLSADLRDEWREIRKLRLQLSSLDLSVPSQEPVIAASPAPATPRPRAKRALAATTEAPRIVAPVRARALRSRADG